MRDELLCFMNLELSQDVFAPSWFKDVMGTKREKEISLARGPEDTCIKHCRKHALSGLLLSLALGNSLSNSFEIL